VDPGAWTNLVGRTLARKAAERAIANGYKPQQKPMTQTLKVAGVGRGTQDCNWKLELPIAVQQDNGTHLHQLSSPIVEGDGEDLPGLLGLDSIERNRGILDTGDKKRLIFPGPGKVQIILPPGSIEIPLEKAPSGHLVMVIDAYEKLDRSKGGLPKEDSSISLMTTPGEPEFLSVTSSAVSDPYEYEHAAEALDLRSGL
jgi:hypothetical protein